MPASLYKFDLVADKLTQISNNLEDDVKVITNPATNSVEINSKVFIVSISIFDFNGHQQFQALVNNFYYNISFDSSHLKQGIYLVRIVTNDSICDEKILIR